MAIQQLMLAQAASSGGGDDPHWANVVSLLHFETDFTDEKGIVWTPNGDVSINTGDGPFGGSSMQLDGNGDFISCAASAAFGFGTGDLTIEGWYYRLGTNTNAFMADLRVAAGESFMAWCSQSAAANCFGYSNQIGTGFARSSANIFPLGEWKHWAITRASGSVRGFVAGAQVFSTTDSRDLASPQGVMLGSSSSANQGASGRIAEWRTTKGVARYTSAFTPPAAPFPNS